MTDSMEPRLRAALDAEVRAVRDLPHLAEQVVRRGRRVRHRRRGYAGTALACALAVLIGGPSLLGDGDRRSDLRPAQAPGAALSPTAAQAVARLPIGPPPGVPFVADSVLYDNGKPLESFGPVAAPVTATRYGILVVQHGSGFAGANDYDAQYALVGGPVGYRLLATGGPRGASVSPDGELVAVGLESVKLLSKDKSEPRTTVKIVHLADPNKVTETRVPRGSRVVGWYRNGVVISEPGSGVTWWRLGADRPSPMTVEGHAVELGGEHVLVRVKGNCTRAVSLSAPDQVVAEGCNSEGRAITSLSPSGRWALREDGAVVNLTSEGLDGPVLSWLPSQATWEDADHLLFVVERTSDEGSLPVVIIRCAVTDGRCEVTDYEAAEGLTSRWDIRLGDASRWSRTAR